LSSKERTCKEQNGIIMHRNLDNSLRSMHVRTSIWLEALIGEDGLVGGLPKKIFEYKFNRIIGT